MVNEWSQLYILVHKLRKLHSFQQGPSQESWDSENDEVSFEDGTWLRTVSFREFQA